MFLICGNCPGALKKHIETMEEFKGAGLFANDLDTGVLSLNQKRS